MNDYKKKLRHLSATILHWGEENKIRTTRRGNTYSVPDNFKKDLKFVTKLDLQLNKDYLLTKKEMRMCNKLYEYYR